MPYTDFDLQSAQDRLGLVLQTADLFPGLAAVALPSWLPDTLARGRELTLASEKARNEFIVAPVLLAARELTDRAFAIYSGLRFDVDPARGLSGECDFLLSLHQPVPIIQAPVVAVVEAKKADIDLGLGQCVAQMVGVKEFNDRRGNPVAQVHGCVTTGDDWQFLRLEGGTVTFDPPRRYIRDVGELLAIFVTMVRLAVVSTTT